MLLWGSWLHACASRSFRASFSSSVPEALRVLDVGDVDAVVLDFRIGEGTSLLAMGAALRAVGYARTVVLTGDREAAIRACEDAGLAVRIVQKPAALADLLEMIRA